MSSMITVQTSVNADVKKVWDSFNNPDHIVKWNQPSPDWHSVSSKNDLRAGGAFSTRMEAKDGSMGFDFAGIYDVVEENKYIEYTLGDGRKVNVHFSQDGENTKVVESFDPENINPAEMQQAGWQAILDSFKKYTESL
ncbi:MAG: polyketide cyclase [Sphingobacteriales bacterium]|nr:MAG: polyketide cyclase [Sphingobacteriales bacterium]